MNNDMMNEGVLHHSMNDPALYSAINKLMRTKNSEEFDRPSRLPDDTVVTMAYVPLQFYKQEYDPNEGFCFGTIFPELNKPFMPGDVR